MKHNWTDNDKTLIKEQYSEDPQTVYQLAATIGVSPSAVRRRASYLGVAKTKRVRGEWTEKQEEKLKDLLGKGLSYEAIAIKMSRTRTSIIHKTYKLKCKYGNSMREDIYTLEEASAVLGFSKQRTRQLLLSGTLIGTHNGDSNGKWTITRAALVLFVRKYPGELTGRNVDMVQLVDILVGVWTAAVFDDRNSDC